MTDQNAASSPTPGAPARKPARAVALAAAGAIAALGVSGVAFAAGNGSPTLSGAEQGRGGGAHPGEHRTGSPAESGPMQGGQMSGQARHEEMHEGVPGADHDGMHEMRGGGHPGMHAGMNVFGGRVQHGEAAVTLPDGSTATVRVQAGEVTAVDDSSITVKSPDGVEQSWPTSGSTKVDKAHSAAALADINVGDHVVVSGKVSAGSVSADRIHLMPAESGAEHTGPQGEPTSGTDD